jgi:hypothetical protein
MNYRGPDSAKPLNERKWQSGFFVRTGIQPESTRKNHSGIRFPVLSDRPGLNGSQNHSFFNWLSSFFKKYNILTSNYRDELKHHATPVPNIEGLTQEEDYQGCL